MSGFSKEKYNAVVSFALVEIGSNLDIVKIRVDSASDAASLNTLESKFKSKFVGEKVTKIIAFIPEVKRHIDKKSSVYDVPKSIKEDARFEASSLVLEFYKSIAVKKNSLKIRKGILASLAIRFNSSREIENSRRR